MRFTELCLKPYGVHKSLILMIPQWMSICIPAIYDTLHVICENVLRNTKVLKSMYYAYEKVLLLGIREKLNIAAPTVMTYHCKTGSTVSSYTGIYIHEAPVHLEAFTRLCLISTATVSLRRNNLTLGRYEIQM